MKISIRNQVIEFRISGAYALTGGQEENICAEGYWFPAPNTEAKLGWSMDFDEAMRLRDQLTEAIKSAPCPHCGRKDAP